MTRAFRITTRSGLAFSVTSSLTLEQLLDGLEQARAEGRTFVCFDHDGVDAVGPALRITAIDSVEPGS